MTHKATGRLGPDHPPPTPPGSNAPAAVRPPTPVGRAAAGVLT